MHSEAQGKEFYVPNKAVVRETAESTKIRIVYFASPRGNVETSSLNDCLKTGPPLQNKLWSLLVRNRFQPVALARDLKQAFLQVRIREEDRDVMRFHSITLTQTRGNLTLYTSTVRFVHVAILTWGSDRLAPEKSSEHLPKRSRRDTTKPLRGRLNQRAIKLWLARST